MKVPKKRLAKNGLPYVAPEERSMVEAMGVEPMSVFRLGKSATCLVPENTCTHFPEPKCVHMPVMVIGTSYYNEIISLVHPIWVLRVIMPYRQDTNYKA